MMEPQQKQYSKELEDLINKAEKGLGKHSILFRCLVAAMILTSCAIVYLTGGTQYAFVHITYLPIIFSAFLLNSIEVLFISILTGLLLGPFMPLNVTTQTYQQYYSWLMRMGFFIFFGQLMSYFIQRRNSIRSELIKAHHELKQNNIILEEKVKERTADLEKINEHRMELLHILCHDLKNPIGTIQTICNIFKSQDLQTKEKAEYERIISMSSDRALEIIKLIREYEALELNKSELKLSAINLREAITESLTIISSRIKSKQLSVDNQLPNSINVLVEPSSFVYSILNNILTNAVKFSHQGSTITIKAKTEDHSVTLSIQDQGIGIPKALLERLFDIHEKTTRPGTSGEEGTGFGMPLVKKFIEAYGGSIDVKSQTIEESPNNHGTEILLTLRTA